VCFDASVSRRAFHLGSVGAKGQPREEFVPRTPVATAAAAAVAIIVEFGDDISTELERIVGAKSSQTLRSVTWIHPDFEVEKAEELLDSKTGPGIDPKLIERHASQFFPLRLIAAPCLSPS
jgi:hypothetical protein